ncbi:MAG: tRNA (adenosine(37)-N6)-threonylcarbamoyltransferase complex dimerization subunit type 1 TsaB [Pseudomonadota bacterium]
MKILSLDTSTSACSVALMIDDQISAHCSIAPRQHAKLILPAVDKLLHDAELFLSDLDAIAFCQGPGSFTGIRLAASLVQGLAYGADLPVIPVSTLAAMALGAYRKFGVSRVLPALDAKMGQIYWAAYHLVDEKTVEAIRVDSLADPEQMVMPSTGEWIGVGDGWQSYGLKAACNHRLIAVHQEFYPQARSILAFAADQLQKGKGISACHVLPIYLRDDVVS